MKFVRKFEEKKRKGTVEGTLCVCVCVTSDEGAEAMAQSGNNVMICDNPISLDEIEKGLWLGEFEHSIEFFGGNISEDYPSEHTAYELLVWLCVCHFGDLFVVYECESFRLISILGSFTAATDVETLKQRNITHILTLDICPLPVHITELPFITSKFIHGSFVCGSATSLSIAAAGICYNFNFLFLSFPCTTVSDTPKEDLLGYFEECCDFIENALADGKTILVHW